MLILGIQRWKLVTIVAMTKTLSLRFTCWLLNNFRRKALGKAEKIKSSEEQQMEQIANIKAEFNKRKKLAQKSYQTAMKSTGYVPVHSKIEPTKPEDFHFETDSRLKSQSSHNTSADKKTDFVRILRSNSRGRSPVGISNIMKWLEYTQLSLYMYIKRYN